MPSYLSQDPKTSGAQPTWVVGPPVLAESRMGKLIEGEYKIQGILGQGELGVSYQAYNARLKRFFAVLMLDRQLLPTHEMMLAVRADLRRAQALGDYAVLPIKQVTDQDGIPGFATELLDGETLAQRLSRGPMPIDRGLSLIVQLGLALEAAHASGLIHGDLRPDSVFLVRPGAKSRFAGRAVLLKHSLRHLRRRPGGFDDSLPIEKLMYRPPEQVAGEVLEADVSGDVFTLGGILHECLMGKPAFGGEDVESVLDRLARPPILLMANTATGLTAPLAEALNVVIAGACARDPQGRIPSMGEFLRALQQVASGAGLALSQMVSEAAPGLPRAGRISRMIQRLSGAFPVIVRPPERRVEPLRPIDPSPPPAAAGPEPATPTPPPANASTPFAEETTANLGRTPAPPAERALTGLAPGALASDATQPPRQREPVDLSSETPQLAPDQRPTQALSRLGREPGSGKLSPAALRLTQQTPLAERSTRQMRARDITQLVAEVQAGRLDPSQAIELAREPEEIKLQDKDLLPATVRPPPQPTAPMRVPVPPPPMGPLRSFLLQHQEIAAAVVGAATILLFGLLLLRCR